MAFQGPTWQPPSGRVSVHTVRGRVITIPKLKGISWYVHPHATLKDNRIAVRTLPVGSWDQVPWAALTEWIEKEKVRLSREAYLSWEQALIRTIPEAHQMRASC